MNNNVILIEPRRSIWKEFTNFNGEDFPSYGMVTEMAYRFKKQNYDYRYIKAAFDNKSSYTRRYTIMWAICDQQRTYISHPPQRWAMGMRPFQENV